jgi:CheY-like chemotaxis protein
MKNGNIAVIALTADAMKGDRERFIESGMDDYLEKPVERNVLLQTIRRWIGKE